MKRTFLILLAALTLAGCRSNNSSFKIDAQGAPYEMVLVAEHNVWQGPAGDSLRESFYRRFPGVNREETSWDVLRVRHADFKRNITTHRNVLVTRIDTALAAPQLSLANDIYARPQTVITASAPDLPSLERLLDTTRNDIMMLLERAEKDRDVAAATKHTPAQIAELIRSKFGIEMSTGPGYTVRSEGDGFLWLSYEMPTASQGLVIYTYPFSGSPDMRQDSLAARRSAHVRQIPGENQGSYMATSGDFQNLLYKSISGRSWAELHGFWRVEGDFMGGPFTNFSTYDAANGRVIAIDCYVYAPDPRTTQRNLIKQLEHLIYTVKI